MKQLLLILLTFLCINYSYTMESSNDSRTHLLIDSQYQLKSTEEPPLHNAAKYNNPVYATYLIEEEKRNVNAKNQDGDTPLHVAVQYNSIKVAQILLKYNACTSIKNASEETPLELAKRIGNTKMKNTLKSNNRCIIQ